MVRAFVGIGSNINPQQNVRAALQRLAQRTHVVAISMVYRTAALGRPEQAPYYNCVAQLETSAPPLAVKQEILRPIEAHLGRTRFADKYAPRTIDLDLIVYGDRTVEADGIRIPDPEIMERPFLAIPLFELAPNLVLAGVNRPIAEIAAALQARGMTPLPEYAQLLKRDLERL